LKTICFDTTETDTFLSLLNLPQVTNDQNEKLISKITKEEIRSAIKKLKNGKAPTDRTTWLSLE
uniref:Uncharacterized protein n=1 Tax=Sander lucioperca TaxID=283035 RepID=A0A8D0D5G2_SANLU